MTRVHKIVVQFLNTCHIFISYIVVGKRVATRCNYIWISMYGWTCILTSYIHVAYVVSHAIECHVQLILCNYTNLQFHVLHATEFQLQATVAKPKISSSGCISSYNKLFSYIAMNLVHFKQFLHVEVM